MRQTVAVDYSEISPADADGRKSQARDQEGRRLGDRHRYGDVGGMGNGGRDRHVTGIAQSQGV